MVNVLGDHLANAAGGYEPQRMNNFMIEFHLDGIDDTPIQLSLESAVLPTVSVEEVPLNYLNITRYVAGKAQFDPIPIAMKDMVDQRTANAIDQWFNRVYNPETDQVGFASDYKKEADIILFGPDGSTERSWKLVGCWPYTVSFGQLDMNASDKVVIEMSIRYDKAFATFNNRRPR
jgi:hypothetical protein